MSKIKIKQTINKEISSYEGIKTKNSIIYKISDMSIKVNIADIVNFTREDDEFKIEMIFDKNNQTKVSYLLKKYKKCLEFTLETKKIEYGENYVDIIYRIIECNDADINFKLEFEEI